MRDGQIDSKARAIVLLSSAGVSINPENLISSWPGFSKLNF